VSTPTGGLDVIEVTPERWHDRVAAELAGGRFAALWADREDGTLRVAVAIAHGASVSVLRTRPDDGEMASVVGLVPAAEWDEREAHDLFGVRFAGHAPLRALVTHPRATADWTTPVIGEDVHQVAVGPIHAGIIESGHFRFHVVGERILQLDLRMFYKHRGLEASVVGATPEAALAAAQRACAACAVTNAVAVAQAYEATLGGMPDVDLRRARTLLLELERLYNHTNDIGAVCAGIGFAAGSMAFASLKERAQRLNARLTGHRFLFGTVCLGASDLGVDDGQAREFRAEVAGIGRDAADLWYELWRNGSVRSRFTAAGVLTPAEAVRLGTLGPAGRASGSAHDVRSDSPRLWYPGFTPAALDDPAGDVAARLWVRVREIAACCAILDDLLADPIAPGRIVVGGPETGLGVAVVESPRGQTVAVLERSGGVVRRMHLRTGSYANWPSLAAAATDAILPDFPLINKSFELCYACADR
jgi:Ni,Fe-hydrogenase III large subunit